jgi:hypothetical protein
VVWLVIVLVTVTTSPAHPRTMALRYRPKSKDYLIFGYWRHWKQIIPENQLSFFERQLITARLDS